MKEKEISAAAFALKKDLTDSILTKLDRIREKIITEQGSTKSSYLQMLLMVDEDLGDVLLNWEYDSINPRLSFLGEDELDDDE
jgi:hypothetical protein